MRTNAEIEDSVAAAVVDALLAREAIWRDLGGVQMREFDIVFEDGHVEPLEVTVHDDEATVQAMARFERHGGIIHANFARVWLVQSAVCSDRPDRRLRRL
jgi:hypothetical protein